MAESEIRGGLSEGLDYILIFLDGSQQGTQGQKITIQHRFSSRDGEVIGHQLCSFFNFLDQKFFWLEKVSTETVIVSMTNNKVRSAINFGFKP